MRAPLVIGAVAAAIVFAAVLIAGGGGEDPAPATAREGAPAPETGERLFAEMGCGGCHTFAAAGAEGPIGPSLDFAAGDYSVDALVARIAATDQNMTVMPTDFGERMTDAELRTLAEWLVANAAG